MFIYSVKASTLRFSAILLAAAALFCALFFLVPPYEAAADAAVTSVRYDKIKTNDDRRAFLSSFGYDVSAEALEGGKVRIPKEFDKIYAGYNEIQKSQGLDLSKYRGKEVERYTYRVENYEGYDGTVYATLLIRRGRVIGGDVCSADPGGFVHGFSRGTA